MAFSTLSVWLGALLIVSSGFVQAQQDDRPGILYPQESETRELKSLDGIWNFRLAPRLDPDFGFRNEWNSKPLAETGDVDLMPVPSSYNDITQNKDVRDHVGWAWYDRTFFVPKEWQNNRRVFLRFGSAHYNSIVYVNGQKVVEHSGGALPFLAELSGSTLNFKAENRITVAINNTLSRETVPQGSVIWQPSSRFPEGYFTLNYNFDFFNYAGIHRSVFLYATPREYVDDIDVIPSINGTTGIVKYSIKVRSSDSKKSSKSKARAGTLTVSLVDREGKTVAISTGASEGVLEVPNANLWWPFTMVKDDQDAGYLYTLVVVLVDPNQDTTGDVYRLKVGIRSIAWDNKEFLINGKPFYFRGYGRHEDFNVRGKGIDNVMIVKDHNLIKWTGGNSYRTSHYPYSEEIMDLADRLGIVIIDEVPAVAIDGFGPALLANHKEQMRELIHRDKNRASVVMWSVSNEPLSNQAAADSYFKDVIELTKSLDAYRPVTCVVAQQYSVDVTAKYVDILSINRYFSWYSDAGHTEVIAESMRLDVENWVNKFNKPLIVSEYGADTVAGLHMSPEFVFTEEYQTTMMREHFKAFDYLRRNSSLIGEHIWNFADFMTAQGITRITGNRKGIFTRDRQPKASAHLLRLRYHLLAAEYDNYPIPEDLQETIPVFQAIKRRSPVHDEH